MCCIFKAGLDTSPAGNSELHRSSHGVWSGSLDFLEPVPFRSIEPDPCSDITIGVITEWLHECFTSDEHPRCRWPSSQVDLPARVVDVGPSDGSQDLFLMVTKGALGRYAALSHCWEELGSPTMVTTANYSAMQTRIRFDTLSANLRDAMIVCRKLGIRLHWADSLCILQDSPEDWAQESSNKTDIFRNSYLTIGASAAERNDQGFLAIKTSDVPIYCFQARLHDSTKPYSIHVRRAPMGLGSDSDYPGM